MNSREITSKDLLLLCRDRRTLSVLVALPLAFISILGFSTGQLFSQADKSHAVKVGIVDADATDLSENIVQKLRGMSALTVSDYPDRSAARSALAEDKIHVLLYIGPKYHEKVGDITLYDLFHVERGNLRGKLKVLDMAVESGSFLANSSQIVQELVFAFSLQTMAPSVLDKDPKLKLQIARASRRSDGETETETEESTPAATPEDTAARSFNTIVYQTLVPAYTVMFVFFIVTFMARSFIGERDMGTLNRLRMAPITRTGLMIGKTIPFLVISLVQTGLLFLAGKWLFGMDWGPRPLLLLPVMFCTSAAATSLGLMVATLVRTEAQVSAYGNFLVLTMAGISGCMMPRTWQSELMQKVGLITPHAWALIAYDQILNRPDPEMSVVVKSCLVMLAFAGGFFAIGWWRSRDLE